MLILPAVISPVISPSGMSLHHYCWYQCHFCYLLVSNHMAVCWLYMQVIPCEWLKLFNTQEVNQLLGGGENAALDVTDMAAHAQYSGGYNKNQPTIKIFWKVWV